VVVVKLRLGEGQYKQVQPSKAQPSLSVQWLRGQGRGERAVQAPSAGQEQSGAEGVTTIETTGGPGWRERPRGQLGAQARAAVETPGSLRLTGRAAPAVLGGAGLEPLGARRHRAGTED
jgi:hypothetical protein